MPLNFGAFLGHALVESQVVMSQMHHEYGVLGVGGGGEYCAYVMRDGKS